MDLEELEAQVLERPNLKSREPDPSGAFEAIQPARSWGPASG